LPEWLGPPITRETQTNDVIGLGGGEDTRVLQCYPTSGNTAVEQTGTHTHVDEWSRMHDPEAVWQAIEPTLRSEGDDGPSR
jgi:hypothetical protein